MGLLGRAFGGIKGLIGKVLGTSQQQAEAGFTPDATGFLRATSKSGWVLQAAYGKYDSEPGLCVIFKSATVFYPGRSKADALGIASSGGNWVHKSGLYKAPYKKISKINWYG